MLHLLSEFIRLVVEMPHIEVSDHAVLRSLGSNKDIMIDFRIERLPIKQEEKKALLQAFNSSGFVGFLEGSWFVFSTLENMRVATDEDVTTLKHLPDNWVDFAIIL